MHDDDDSGDLQPSKSQRKREAHALQQLGAQLLEVPEEDWHRLDLPATLVQALKEARKIRSHGARKRQLQYIGKLMRDVEPGPVQQYFEQRRLQHRRAAERHQLLERLRDTLVEEGDAALGAVLDEFPDADRQQLRQLIRQARREREAERPPKAARALFRYLRDLG